MTVTATEKIVPMFCPRQHAMKTCPRRLRNCLLARPLIGPSGPDARPAVRTKTKPELYHVTVFVTKHPTAPAQTSSARLRPVQMHPLLVN